MDRNPNFIKRLLMSVVSLSARRAWIETDSAVDSASGTLVALRKESVDRNRVAKYRRIPLRVALRKESVDRNYSFGLFGADTLCRSPQGERG